MMMTASIFFSCGPQAGLGHTRRCMTLAKALRNQGLECHVHLCDPMGQPLVEHFGFNPEPWAGKLKACDIGIIDFAGGSRELLRTMFQDATYTCLVDDLATRPARADAIINPNLYAEGLDYSAYDTEMFFLGPNYHLLDASFFASTQQVGPKQGVVVSFGGTDNGKLAGPVIRKLLGQCDRDIYWPIPSTVEPAPWLVSVADVNPKFHILRDCDMAALLSKSELYVGSAGATLIEAISAACKYTVCAIVENQKINVGFLLGKGGPALIDYDAQKMADLALHTLAKGDVSKVDFGGGPDVIAAHLVQLSNDKKSAHSAAG